MRVLHIYKTAFPITNGGIEQVIHQLSSGLVDKGVFVDVLALSNKKNESISINGYSVHFEKCDLDILSNGISFSVIKRFIKLAKNADLIHYHYPWPFMDMMVLLFNINKPSVLTYHSDIVRQKKSNFLYNPFRRLFFSKINRIIVTSPNYLYSSVTLQEYKDKISIIPIGINDSLNSITNDSHIIDWRKKLGDKFYLFVGVFRYYKGLDILLQAAKSVDYKIVLIGNGDLYNDISNKCKEYNLDNVILLGNVSDIDKEVIFRICYAFIFPSNFRSEAFGVALLEAAMFNKPMISTEIGTGTSYININNETGLVIRPNDPIALVQAMSLLWNDPNKVIKMGINARKRYEKIFKLENMVDSYFSEYLKILN